jgi:hypothetical protein
MPIYRELSTPLVELPTYLSTISMIVDDKAAIVQKLIQAKRKSPPVYQPSRDLFLKVLQGKLSFDGAVIQSRRLADETERKCAVQIIDASEHFLRNERSTNVSELLHLAYPIPNGLNLNISPVWLRHFSPERLIVLHFWQTPLTPRQLSAAASVLRTALFDCQLQYSTCEIDFISVAFSRFGNTRRFERYNWSSLKLLSENELARFWNQFISGWSQYQRLGPREIKRKRIRDLLD